MVGARRLAVDDCQPPPSAFAGRLTINKPAGIGVQRPGEHFAFVAHLAEPAAVHHRDPVAGLRHHPEIVGDHNDRQPQLGTQVAEQAQNLHLHGDVQRGRRFVGNQQPRFRREGDGDHRPLAHTAGKFVRIAIEPILRVRDADLAQQGQRIFPRLTAVCRKMEAPAFRDLLPNGHHRIEMAGRVLENHTDFPPAHRRHLPFAEG